MRIAHSASFGLSAIATSFGPWAACGAMISAALALAACARTDPAASFSLVVHVESDPGHPLPGAAVSLRNRPAGITGDAGDLALSVRGTEGEHVSLSISCPDGFKSPSESADAVLHRLDDPARKAEYEFRCRPERREVVVVVRADRGPHLPVMYLGREVGRTDESGAAHVLLDVPANDDVEVSLSTHEPGAERLRPQDPAMKFVASDQASIKIFSVAFELEREKRPPAAARARMPVRIN